MTADAGELKNRVSGSKDEVENFGDLKCGNELKNNNACCEGEEIGGSFVIVNGDSDDGIDRDLGKNDSENGNSKLEDESSHENGKKLEEKSEGWNLVHGRSNGDCIENEKEKEKDGGVINVKENKEVVEFDNGKVEEGNKVIMHEEEKEVLDVAKEKQDGQTLTECDPKVELESEAEVPEVEMPITVIPDLVSVVEPEAMISELQASGDLTVAVGTEVKQDLTVAEEEDVGLNEVEERSDLVIETETTDEVETEKTGEVETEIKQGLIVAVEEMQDLAEVKEDVKLESKQDLGFAKEVNESADLENLVTEIGHEVEVLASEPQLDIVVDEEQNTIDVEAETNFDSGSTESEVLVNGTHAEQMSNVEAEPEMDHDIVVEETENGEAKLKHENASISEEADLESADLENLVTEIGHEVEVLASEPQLDIVVDEEQNTIDVEAETHFDSGSTESEVLVNGTHAEQMSNVQAEPEMDHDIVVEETENGEAKLKHENASISEEANNIVIDVKSKRTPDPADENTKNAEVRLSRELDPIDEDTQNVVVDLSHESHPVVGETMYSELALEHKPDSVVEVIKNVVVEVDHGSDPIVEDSKNIGVELEQESNPIVEEVQNVEEEVEQESDPIVEEVQNVEEEVEPESDPIVEEVQNVEEEVEPESDPIVEEVQNVEVELEQGSDPKVEEMENVEVQFKHESDPIVEEAKHVDVELELESVPIAEEAEEAEKVEVHVSDPVVDGTKNAVIKSKAASDPIVQKVEKSELDASAREYVPLNLVLVNTGNERVDTHVKDVENHRNTIEPRSEVDGVSLETELSSKSKSLTPASEKELTRNEIRVESKSGTEGSKCMDTSIEDEKPTNIYHEEEKSIKQAQSAETVQAPLETHVVRKHYIYMIKVPKVVDDGLEMKIQHAWSIVQEKTNLRDSIGEETRQHAAVVNNYSLDYKAELAKEKAARAVFNAKRKEIDNVQVLLSRLNNANSIADIDEKIRTMVHKQQHETITLKQEKQYIHDITQMKRLKEQLSSKNPAQEQIVEAINQKDEIESQHKNLKKELDSLRVSLASRESSVKSAWNKYMEQDQILKTLREKYNAADVHRQEAYLNYRKLTSQRLEKNKHNHMYKDDQQDAANYMFLRDTQGLRSHCTKQVEKVMDIWNKSPDFRQQYVKSNTYSTLRRLGTADGRQLGPGEVAPTTVRPQFYRNKNTVSSPSSSTQPSAPVLKAEVTREQSTEPSKSKQEPKSKQSAKPRVSTSEELKEKEKLERETKLKKEEEEKAKKEEEIMREKAVKEEERMREKAAAEEKLRKEKEAVELKEKLRLEQKLKAKEAEERKKRKAEKAKARAEIKAQKEAELKEKKKTKKENKKSGISDTGSEAAEEGPAATETNQLESSQDPDSSSATATKKRSTKIATKTKQYNKVQPLPLPLRNKNKRKMTAWLWAALIVLSVLALFFAGNYISFSSSNISPNFDI